MNSYDSWAFLFLIPILAYLLAIMPRMLRRPSIEPFLRYYYAHRGLYDNAGSAPENSRPAFQRAVEKGYGIELDVQLSKDGVCVVFHDEKLSRVCGVEGLLKDYTYRELKRFSLCQSRETIPSLEEVLKLVDGKVPLIVEIKCEDGNTAVCDGAYKLLKDYKGVYCIESFHPIALRWFKKHAPDLVRGQLSTNFHMLGDRRFIMKCHGFLFFNFFSKPDFIAYDCLYVNTLSRRLCKGLFRVPAAAWTVRSGEQLKKMKKHYDLFIFEGFEPDAAKL